MTGLPEPQVGLGISYAYLWFAEARRGQVEGSKDRPCAIILRIESPGSEDTQRKRVAVVPITHSPPHNPSAAIEIPPRVKQHLGLDSERSCVVLDEINVFTWPGCDLRPIRDGGGRVDYGFLPPRFFDQLVAKFAQLATAGSVSRASRDE
jgi:hypothetical protein